MIKQSDMDRNNRIAQWAFDTRGILGRFHLWLEDVEERWIEGQGKEGTRAFVGESLERAFIVANAVTALGTKLFGRWGEGKGLDSKALNRIKKDADAVSAYALSEALWYLTRSLPENHALMVSMGEGLMPKGGETPEMGSNPLLGFGRVYARPQIATLLDQKVHRLVNEPGYEWARFWGELQEARITVWGAAIDTLENTSRFAKGNPTGPMAVMHLFDQPLKVSRPYEGYMGTLVLPKRVIEHATERSVLIDYLTPRSLVMESILSAYPELRPQNVHVWTLGGPAREKRISQLWQQWRELGADVVEDGWIFPPTGMVTFTESGTYAPVQCVGSFTDQDGQLHFLLCDGYAASAEAIQAASLDPVCDLHSSLCLFSSKFNIPYDREAIFMRLDPDAQSFSGSLAALLGDPITSEQDTSDYRKLILDSREALMPTGTRSFSIDHFFPYKEWRVLALSSCMLPDPYTGMPGVEHISEQTYRVTTRASTQHGILEVDLSLRLMEPPEEMRMVFSPLLDRFYAGQDYRTRPVKISDSGRIRNELQTLCSEALEYLPNNQIAVHFDQIDEAVMPHDKKSLIRDALIWYKQHHPFWFRWLKI